MVQRVWEIGYRTLFSMLWNSWIISRFLFLLKKPVEPTDVYGGNTWWALLILSLVHAVPSRVTFKFLLLESSLIIYILLESCPLHVDFQICWPKEQDFHFTVTFNLHNLNSDRLISHAVYLCYLFLSDLFTWVSKIICFILFVERSISPIVGLFI